MAGVGMVGKMGSRHTSAGDALLDPLEPVLVIDLALLGVTQHLVRERDLLELLATLGRLLWILVRMVLAC